MPGTNAGTGQPIWFRCLSCRKNGRRCCGFISDVTLTGTVKRKDDGRSHGRSSNVLVEYECKVCRYRGFSRHIDIAKRAQREGLLS